jgi:hypothetical protein
LEVNLKNIVEFLNKVKLHKIVKTGIFLILFKVSKILMKLDKKYKQLINQKLDIGLISIQENVKIKFDKLYLITSMNTKKIA